MLCKGYQTSMLATISALLASCVSAEVWIVKRDEGWGILGYKANDNKSSRDLLRKQLDAQAKNLCGNADYRFGKDLLQSKDYSGTMYLPNTKTTNSSATIYGSGGTMNAYGTSSTTENVPYQYSGTTYWREAEVICKLCSPKIGIEFENDKSTTIAGFLPESKAKESGLKIGDRVISVDGRRVGTPISTEIGKTTEVVFERNGKVENLQVTVVRICNF